MCLEVNNLFNNKKVILSKEEILQVVLFAIQNCVVNVSFDCPIDEVDCSGVYESVNLIDIEYNVELIKESDND